MDAQDLIEAREALGISPTAMARVLGVPYHTYNNWESGRRKIAPTVERLIELALAVPPARKYLLRAQEHKK